MRRRSNAAAKHEDTAELQHRENAEAAHRDNVEAKHCDDATLRGAECVRVRSTPQPTKCISQAQNISAFHVHFRLFCAHESRTVTAHQG